MVPLIGRCRPHDDDNDLHYLMILTQSRGFKPLPFAVFDVDDKEHDAEQKNNATHNDVTDTKEWIFATKQRGRRYDKTFAASK